MRATIQKTVIFTLLVAMFTFQVGLAEASARVSGKSNSSKKQIKTLNEMHKEVDALKTRLLEKASSDLDTFLTYKLANEFHSKVNNFYPEGNGNVQRVSKQNCPAIAQAFQPQGGSTSGSGAPGRVRPNGRPTFVPVGSTTTAPASTTTTPAPVATTPAPTTTSGSTSGSGATSSAPTTGLTSILGGLLGGSNGGSGATSAPASNNPLSGLFGGGSNPLSSIFGGGSNPLSSIFGGGSNPLSSIFGGGSNGGSGAASNPLSSIFGGGSNGGSGAASNPVSSIFGNLGNLLGGGSSSNNSSSTPGVGGFLGNVFGNLFGGGSNGGSNGLLGNLGSTLGNLFNSGGGSGNSTVGNLLGTLGSGLINGLTSGGNFSIKSFLFNTIWNMLSSFVIKKVTTFINKIANQIQGQLSGAGNAFASNPLFAGIGSSFTNIFVNLINTLKAKALQFVTTMLNKAKTAIKAKLGI